MSVGLLIENTGDITALLVPNIHVFEFSRIPTYAGTKTKHKQTKQHTHSPHTPLWLCAKLRTGTNLSSLQYITL
jgi:hypothetical protein